MKSPDLLDMSSVMHQLGLCRKSVMRLIVIGDLPAYKISRQWRFDPRAVDRFLQASQFRVQRKPEPAVVRSPRTRSTAMTAGADRYL